MLSFPSSNRDARELRLMSAVRLLQGCGRDALPLDPGLALSRLIDSPYLTDAFLWDGALAHASVWLCVCVYVVTGGGKGSFLLARLS